MAHPVCTENQDVVQEGVRFRCHVNRIRGCNSKPFEEFPDLRYREERYEIRVWANPEESYSPDLVKLSANLNCSKLYDDKEQTEFENPEDQIKDLIDSLCWEIWQNPLVCKFRAHARACDKLCMLAVKYQRQQQSGQVVDVL